MERAEEKEKHKHMWPSHIDVSTNDWTFTKENLDSSPSILRYGGTMTPRDENNAYQKLFSAMERICYSGGVFFVAAVYLRRYFQRNALTRDYKADLSTAAMCVFLAARTLELHVPMDNIIRKLLQDQYKGSLPHNKTTKEFYYYKDLMLKQEMVIMEKLCFEMTIMDPMEALDTIFSVVMSENPHEVADSRDVQKFWGVLRLRPPKMDPAEQTSFYFLYRKRICSWARTNLTLLYPVDYTIYACLVYMAAHFQIVFPKHYFKTRNIQLDPKIWGQLWHSIYQLPSTTGHPPQKNVSHALSQNEDLLTDESGADALLYNDSVHAEPASKSPPQVKQLSPVMTALPKLPSPIPVRAPSSKPSPRASSYTAQTDIDNKTTNNPLRESSDKEETKNLVEVGSRPLVEAKIAPTALQAPKPKSIPAPMPIPAAKPKKDTDNKVKNPHLQHSALSQGEEKSKIPPRTIKRPTSLVSSEVEKKLVPPPPSPTTISKKDEPSLSKNKASSTEYTNRKKSASASSASSRMSTPLKSTSSTQIKRLAAHPADELPTSKRPTLQKTKPRTEIITPIEPVEIGEYDTTKLPKLTKIIDELAKGDPDDDFDSAMMLVEVKMNDLE